MNVRTIGTIASSAIHTVALALASAACARAGSSSAPAPSAAVVVEAVHGACTGPARGVDGRENLGTCVNSAFADIAPQISPDGQTLYFDRKNDPANTGGAADRDDIWYSIRQPDGSWSPARNLGAPLNTARENFVAAVMPGGNTLLLGNVYGATEAGGSGVSITHRTRDGWSAPEALHIRNFQNRNEYASYYLSQAGQALLMAIERDGGAGDQDLHVSFRQADGSWSEPLNLGPTVNTADDEDSPFLASDGVTLYFSSGGHGGYGDNDILVTRRLDDTWRNWSKPENLGPTINTPGFDAGFVIPASGEYAYFISTRDSHGSADIFRAPLPKALRPRPVVLVRGQIVDTAGRAPVAGEVTYQALEGTEHGATRTNPTTGEYQVVLPTGELYAVQGEVPHAYPEAVTVDLRDVEKYDERVQDIAVVPLRPGAHVRLGNVLFDFGKATLRPESRVELNRLADFLQRNPTLVVQISGHTDNVGSGDVNRLLSKQRARAVAVYLNDKGIARRRALPYGYGETQPVASNATDEGRQRNRRVEFKVVRM